MKTEGGAREIKIIVTELDERGRRVPKRPPSLVGKHLLHLNGIKTDFSPGQAKGKMILVCFSDMNQRPSRYCITELAKQAEELREKGVTIVAIQAPKVDEDTLNEWLKEHSVSFSVGTVEGDEEKTRFAWGVQSLPWLILADKEHIIRAEGFALEELDKKIKQAGDSEK